MPKKASQPVDPTANTPKEKKNGRSKKTVKKAHTPPVEVHLQIGGQDYDCTAIVEMARVDYRATHKTGIHSCHVYIKPEEQAAYYVINRAEGKVAIQPTETL